MMQRPSARNGTMNFGIDFSNLYFKNMKILKFSSSVFMILQKSNCPNSKLIINFLYSDNWPTTVSLKKNNTLINNLYKFTDFLTLHAEVIAISS